MCWRSNNPVKKIAEENIHVFKIMKNKENELRSIYAQFLYEINKLYSSNIENPIKHHYKYYDINKGFHSYSIQCKLHITRDKAIYIISIYNDVLDVFPSKINGWNIVKINCIIPEGSEYYLNERGEFVSNKIKVISIENVLV